ncbi:uncharacterized protein BDW70DRAFT_163975 [Aspergillus foveolatus]|uniref:uncharacterized protein n=1 Tax=Aspergillus foveolatus TaxID=210207 RepID=UPI003CCE46D1
MATFLSVRLALGMYPLIIQVRIATWHPVRLVKALMTGQELVSRDNIETETNYSSLSAEEIPMQGGPNEVCNDAFRPVLAAGFTMVPGMPEDGVSH